MSLTVISPLRLLILVDDQQFLDAVLVQDALRFFQRRSDRNGDEIVLGHDFANRQMKPRFEAQIAIGQDAHQPSVLGDRHAGDLVVRHQLHGVFDLFVRATS